MDCSMKWYSTNRHQLNTIQHVTHFRFAVCSVWDWSLELTDYWWLLLSNCTQHYRLRQASSKFITHLYSSNRNMLLLLLLRLFVTRKIAQQGRKCAVRKCSCLCTMYHINNNIFSSVLKVVRLQSDIRNAEDKLFHTEGPDTAKLLSP